MMHAAIYVAETGDKGRGVFTEEVIDKDTVVEISPVIVMEATDRQLLDKTKLHDYIFEWGENRDQCAMALGYIPIYNHGCPSNCEYFMLFEEALIMVKTVRDIVAGEELLINYHGDHDKDAALWFEKI